MSWHPHTEAAVQKWIALRRPALHRTLGDEDLLPDLIGQLRSEFCIENLEFVSALTLVHPDHGDATLRAVPGGLGRIHQLLPVPLEQPPPPPQRDAQGQPAAVSWADWRAVALFLRFVTTRSGGETANLPSQLMASLRAAYASPVETLHGEHIAASGLTLQALAEGLPEVVGLLQEAYLRYRAGLDKIVTLRESDQFLRFADAKAILDEERRHQGAKLRSRRCGRVRAYAEMADGLPLFQISVELTSAPRAVRQDRVAPLVTDTGEVSEGRWVREGRTVHFYFTSGAFENAGVGSLGTVLASHGAGSLQAARVDYGDDFDAIEVRTRPKHVGKLPAWARKAVSETRHAGDALGRGVSEKLANHHTKAAPTLHTLTATKMRSYDSVDEALAGARGAMQREVAGTKATFIHPFNQRVKTGEPARKIKAVREGKDNKHFMVYVYEDTTVRRKELRVFEIWLYGGSAPPPTAAVPREQRARWVRILDTRTCLDLARL